MSEPDDDDFMSFTDEELEEYEQTEAYEAALIFGGQNYWDGEDEVEHDDEWYMN